MGQVRCVYWGVPKIGKLVFDVQGHQIWLAQIVEKQNIYAILILNACSLGQRGINIICENIPQIRNRLQMACAEKSVPPIVFILITTHRRLKISWHCSFERSRELSRVGSLLIPAARDRERRECRPYKLSRYTVYILYNFSPLSPHGKYKIISCIYRTGYKVTGI